MPTFKFSKLVRDKIVDHQLSSGAKPIFRKLNPQEHKQALINKIVEEAEEISTAGPDEIAAEIADVQQAIDDLCTLYGLRQQDVRDAQITKNEKNGAFIKGYYVEHVEVDDTNAWIEYYRKKPECYPEIDA